MPNSFLHLIKIILPMLRQTDGRTTRTTRTKLTETDETRQTGYIYGRKTRTDGQTESTDKRTNWINRPDGRTTWRTDWRNWRTGKKERADGQTDWMVGRTNRRDGQIKWTIRTDQTDWMDGQMHQTNGLEGRTRRHMERTYGQLNWIKGPDGRTDWRIELNWTILEFCFCMIATIMQISEVQIILTLIQ